MPLGNYKMKKRTNETYPEKASVEVSLHFDVFGLEVVGIGIINFVNHGMVAFRF